jgi:hypothetical protein
MPSVKVLKQTVGQIGEVASVDTTTGATDAGKLISTNAAGLVDATLLNAISTSAGAADAGKVPQLGANGVLAASIVGSTVASSGAASAGRVVALDGSGRIDQSAMPANVGLEVVTLQATESLAAGSFVNIWISAGRKVRLADASNGRPAHGYVAAAVSSGNQASVFCEGANVGVSGLTAGQPVYLGLAGGCTNTAPTMSGYDLQNIGIATDATSMSFSYSAPIRLA